VSPADRARWGAPAAFGLALLFAAYPPLATLAEHGLSGAFRYLDGDAFYYLTVAKRSAGAAFYTYDGRFPTNGFHPLWQYYLTFGFARLGLGPEGQVLFAFLSGVAFAAVGTCLFAAALQRATGSVALALLASVPGLYYLLLPTLNEHYFSQWSWANGMESSLSVLFFGALCFALVNRRLLAAGLSVPRVLVLTALLTAMVLSRLDDIFLFVPFGALVLAARGAPRQKLLRAVAFGAVPLVCIGAYLAYNLSYAGTLLPVSGAEKNQGPYGLARNGYAVLTTALPFLDLFDRGRVDWVSEAWRVLQMLVPAAAAAAWLGSDRRRLLERLRDGRCDARFALTLLCVYVILKASYNFVLVPLWQQGQWYFPISLMLFGWGVAATLERVGAVRALSGAPALAVVLALLVLEANAFVEVKHSGGLGQPAYRIWVRRDAIAREVERVCPGCGLLEFDDGLFSYSLPMPVMSGTGLSLDATAFEARRRGELLEVAFARGVRLFTSHSYRMAPEVYADPKALRTGLESYGLLRGQDLSGWDFETVHFDAASGVAFVAFRPKSF